MIMSISINWATKVISVPQVDLTPLGGSLYELDVDAFRLTLKDLEDDEAGMAFPHTHNHVGESTLAGTTFARQVEIINGYTVTFQDGQYRVRLAGANNNISDVANLNQVSIVAANSAGLVSNATPEGISDAVWSKLIEAGYDAARVMKIIAAATAGKVSGSQSNAPVFRNLTDSGNQITATTDANGNRTAVSHGA
jgi:hypothetical protein